MMIKHLIFVAAGGALGAMMRFAVGNWVAGFWQGRIPIATLGVNIVGSFLIGVLYVLIAERGIIHPDWRSIAMVGMLGALTTFSTFSLETVHLLEQGLTGAALVYVMTSLAACVFAVWLAMMVTRAIWPA